MSLENMHILVVEDEPDGQEVVRMLLTAAGIHTTVAGSAEEALYMIGQNGGFDAAIFDLALPAMDGFELLQTFRGDPKTSKLPIVAITAFHTPELKVKALDAGFDGYFAKPLDTAIFVGSLENILSSF